MLLAIGYGALALVGLVGTWYFNLSYHGPDYLGDWFANAASSSAAVDILVVFVVCAVFYVRESRRLGWRWWVPVVFAVLSLAVAVAFAFPLFLSLRELRRTRLDRGADRSHSHPAAGGAPTRAAGAAEWPGGQRDVSLGG